MDPNSSYYNEHLNFYSESYRSYHGYLSFVICIFGAIGNITNIVIFTRKSMVSSTNVILTALATSDLLIVLTYMPFAYQNYIQVYLNPDYQLTHDLAYALLVFSQFFLVNHVISVWFTVMLAVWRFVAISFPLAAVRLLTVKRTRCVIVAIYCTATCVCIPQFLTDTVEESEDYDDDGNDVITYSLGGLSELSQKHNKFLQRFTFWFIAIIMEIVPCVLLIFFTLALIKVLYQANVHRRRLAATNEVDPDHRRINKMLLIILLLFVFSEFPSGVMTVLSEILGHDFHANVYSRLAETIDILDLVNHSFNCVIYYVMIRRYRETFNFGFINLVVYANERMRKLSTSDVTVLTTVGWTKPKTKRKYSLPASDRY